MISWPLTHPIPHIFALNNCDSTTVPWKTVSLAIPSKNRKQVSGIYWTYLTEVYMNAISVGKKILDSICFLYHVLKIHDSETWDKNFYDFKVILL